MTKKKKIELLAPAGSPEKMRYAFAWGADAVYLGIPAVSMRARINPFTEESLAESVAYAHSIGKRVFVTLNIYAHNYHLPIVEKHLKFLKNIKVDGVIISDPGIISLVKKISPEIEIHLSTQANTTNWMAAKFWYDLGVKRVVLAREVTLEDIKEIHKRVPKLELEYFVHGAMCMSYSGRCILSKWMVGRSANLGDCAQPCRWAFKQNSKLESLKSNSDENEFEYKTMSVKDTQNKHEVELEEDLHGTYFFNSKDLNLLDHLKALADAGVMSFKVEGRNKSVYYLTTVMRSYRAILDAIEQGKEEKEIKALTKKKAKELDDLMHRGYTKGFLLGNEPQHAFKQTHQDTQYQFVGEILEVNGNELIVKAHNAIYPTDSLEVMSKSGNQKLKVEKIFNDKNEKVESAHGGHGRVYKFKVKTKDIEPLTLIRKKIVETNQL